VPLRAQTTGFRKLLKCRRVLSRPKLQIRLRVVFSTVDVGLCGGFRFLGSGFRASDWISWISLFRQTASAYAA